MTGTSPKPFGVQTGSKSFAYDGKIETLHSSISLRVVLGADDILHPKSATHLHEELPQELRPMFG